MSILLRAVPSKSHSFSTNYHACIAMPTCCRCALPILSWHWPPFNLFPSSCITWIFFVDSHWWVPLCVQCPTNSMPFSTNYQDYFAMPHDIYMYTYFVLTSINLICSCFVSHAATRQIAGVGHPCYDRCLLRSVISSGKEVPFHD